MFLFSDFQGERKHTWFFSLPLFRSLDSCSDSLSLSLFSLSSPPVPFTLSLPAALSLPALSVS